MPDSPPISWSKALRLRISSPDTDGWCGRGSLCQGFSLQCPESRGQPTERIFEDHGIVRIVLRGLTSWRIILDGAIHVLPPYLRVAFRSWK